MYCGKMAAILRPWIGSAVLEFFGSKRWQKRQDRKRTWSEFVAHVRSEEPCKIHIERIGAKSDEKVRRNESDCGFNQPMGEVFKVIEIERSTVVH